MNEFVEAIEYDGEVLAYLIKSQWMPDKTEFVTPDHTALQVGMIAYTAGKSIVPHVHLPTTRQVIGTPECIVVRKGSCVVDFYDGDQNYLKSCNLKLGDALLLLNGGHGFRMIEDTVLFEVKQGPFTGDHDKLRFNDDRGPAI